MMRMRRMGHVVWVLALVGMGMGVALGQTEWNSASDGAWDVAGNWTSGVPDGNDASLVNPDGSYTVSVDTAVANAFNTLTVNNDPANTTTLNIGAAGFRHGGGAVTIGRNATVNLNSGGVWTYPMGVANPNPVFSIIDGGRLNVAGGSAFYTNLNVAMTMYVGRDGNPGSMSVSDGNFTFYSDANSPVTAWNASHISVGHGTDGLGSVELSGGLLRTGSKNAGHTPLAIATGLRSRGSFLLTGGEWHSLGGSWNTIAVGSGTSSYGSMVVSNNAVVTLGGSDRFFLGLGNLSTGRLEVAGGVASISTLHVGSSPGNGVTRHGRVEVTGGVMTNIWGASIGRVDNSTGTGFGAMEISGGTVRMSRRALFIGRGGGGGRAHGEVKISDGTLDVYDTYGINYAVANAAPIYGIGVGGVGHGAQDENLNADGRGYGRLEITGGAVTNRGNFVVGWNGGTGVVEQAAGIVANTRPLLQYMTIIGYGFGVDSVTGHGVGTYRMTGGSFHTVNRVFVGGVAPERPYTTATNHWFSVDGAEGRLDVTGGSFTTASGLYVGDYGTGTVVVGKSGQIFAQTLALADQDATLRFEFGDGGFGSLVVSGAAEIGSAAKLEIDASGAVAGQTYTLVECGSRTGSFALANITVVGGDPTWVDQSSAANITYRGQTGTILFVR